MPPVIRTTRTIARAAVAEVAAFAGSPVGHVVDALGRSGALPTPIKPVTRAREFAGTALTVDAGPRDNLAPWAALKVARPGDVLLIATGGFEAASVCGDLLVGMAANAGIVAIVTDGVVRDVEGMEPAGIPVFAVGVNPNSPMKNGPGSVGLSIVVGGVAVGPGDIVRGDADGVVVVPAARIAEARSALVGVREKEIAMDAAVKGGATAPDWVRDAAPDDLFAYLD